MIPSTDTLFAFAHSQHGETLRTLRDKSPFRVEVVGNFLEIKPDASIASRRESRDSVAAILARLAKTMSFKVSDYGDISFNASYVLALVKRWELPDLPNSIDSERLRIKTGTNVRERPEHIAREQMAEYYKTIKTIFQCQFVNIAN